MLPKLKCPKGLCVYDSNGNCAICSSYAYQEAVDYQALQLRIKIDREILSHIERKAMEENKQKDVKAQAILELDEEEHDKAVRDMKHKIREKRAMPFFTKVRKGLAEALNPELKKKEVPDELEISIRKDGKNVKTWVWEQDHDGHMVGISFPVYIENDFIGDYQAELIINKVGHDICRSSVVTNLDGSRYG